MFSLSFNLSFTVFRQFYSGTYKVKEGPGPTKMAMRGHLPSFENNDRFILNRNNIDFDKSHLLLTQKDSVSPQKFKVFDLKLARTRVLQSKLGPTGDSNSGLIEPTDMLSASTHASDRRFKRYPIDILQAHNASTQFFHNILDVSNKNINAIALNNYVFLWDLNTNSYLSYERDRTTPLTSLAWKEDGSLLAVTKRNYLDILGGPCCDERVRRIKTGFTYCSMDWRIDLVTCGGSSGNVDGYDMRMSSDIPVFSLLSSSKRAKSCHPVVNVKWNPSGRYLATSNPYRVSIWDVLNLKTPVTTFVKHRSAVRALAWCPYEPTTIATGGGFFDGTVNVWNCNSGRVRSSIRLNCQITGLVWSEADRELLTAHARQGPSLEAKLFPNKIHFWKYESSRHSLQRLNHSLCSTEEIVSITKNENFFLALSGFNRPKLYLWENVFNKAPTLIRDYLDDLNKFK